MLGTSLDGYRIEALVGEGSSGRVYRARHASTGRQVAVKVLRASSGAAPTHPAEAELLAGLRHPGIVLVEKRGILDNGRGYLVMPWLEGEDLTARQARAPLTLVQALQTIASLCDALQVAHDASVIHRDIKPANIFLVGSGPNGHAVGQPVLLDFGAATRVELTTFSDQTIIGTPAYMAPELVRGDIHVGPAADIYSLGATLYELLSGRPPHEGPTYFATLARLVTTPATRLTEVNPRIPPEVATYVHTLLALSPDDRPETCSAVAASLRQLATRVHRGSLADPEPHSGRLGSSVQRLVTSLVASGFSDPALRDHSITTLRAHEADTVPLGKHSLVAHFGVRRARGSEATSALNLGRRIAKWGARVGVASGRSMVPVHAAFETSPELGEVIERATLLSRNAESGEVICDATTVELGQLRYRFRERQPGQYLVETRSGSGRSPAATPFVGRDPEFHAAIEAFHRCEDHSLATVVSLSGAPGIGKTRLQREIVLHLLGECGLPYVVQQRNDAYGQRRALGAALDAIRSLLRLPRDADLPTTQNAVRANLSHELADDPSARVDVLTSLLAGSPLEGGGDTSAIRDVLWLLMTEVVLTNLDQSTVVMVSEDIQWADPESLSWFEHLLTRAKNRPLLLIVTARHEFWSTQKEAFTKHNHLKLHLHPVSDHDVRTIVQASLRDARVLGNVTEEEVERVVGQSGGSPLFAEELARLAARGTNVAIAPTIEAAIQVSLDSLDDRQADAVGRLSVLGATVWHTCLSHLGVDDPDGLFGALVDKEILVPHEPSRFAFTNEYQFKHTMIRDVAYARLGRNERRQLHQLAAEWLEQCGEDPAIVARHLDLGELPERAAAYWASAARRALQTNALREALKMAEHAVTFSTEPSETFERAQLLDEVWDRLDARASDRESAIAAMEDNVTDAVSHTYALGARARYDAAKGQGQDVGQRLVQARAQAEQLGLFDEVARCGAELATRAAFAGEHVTAQQEAHRLLTLAHSRPQLKACAVDAWQTLAIVGQSRGALLEALEARRNAANAARSAELRGRESVLTANLGFALTTLGAKVEAKDMLERGIDLATSIGSEGALRHGRMLLLCWTSVFGESADLDAHLDELRTEADEAAAGMWTAPARETLGVLYYRGVELLRRAPGHWSAPRKTSRSQTQLVAARGAGPEVDTSPARARILLRISARGYRTTENHDVLPVALGMWALAEHLTKNSERALQIATEAATLLASGAPSLLNESPIFLTLHDVHLTRGSFADAKAAIEAALPFLLRRAKSLETSSYLHHFLTGLDDNRRLLTLATQYSIPHAYTKTLAERFAAPQPL